MKLETLYNFLPVVAIFISYILGRIESKKTYAYDIKKEQYYSLYVPYIQLLYSIEINKIELFDINSSQYVRNKRLEFINLLNNNIQFIDESSLEHYVEFCTLFKDFQVYPYKMIDYALIDRNIVEESRYIFYLLSISLLEFSIELSNDLKLPKTGKPFLIKYRQDLNKHKRLKEQK